MNNIYYKYLQLLRLNCFFKTQLYSLETAKNAVIVASWDLTHI